MRVLDVSRSQMPAVELRRSAYPRQTGFSGLRDPVIAIGAAASPYLTATSKEPTGAPCPDCPPDCQESDVAETWYLSPEQQSPSDKVIPVTRTIKTCNDDELEIDCDNTGTAPTMNGLQGLGNAGDTSVPDNSTVYVTDAQPCESGMGTTNVILLVLGVATLTALATSALSSGRRR